MRHLGCRFRAVSSITTTWRYLVMQRTKKLAVGIGVGTLVVAGTGAVAVASQSAPNPVIRSCVKNTTGAARIIRAGQSCAAGERLVTWNKAGPAGPAGVASVPRAPGTPGI